MNKFASAHWEGDIKKGKGTISTQSGALKEQPYGFNTRFEDEPGTNPEELIGAAHAGCFSMAFSLELGNAGYTADSIDTKAKVTLDKDGDGELSAEELRPVGGGGRGGARGGRGGRGQGGGRGGRGGGGRGDF